MKFCVINGSPRGEYSITLQTLLYLEKLYPEHRFDFLNVAVEIKRFEKDMTVAIEKINDCDAIIFSYPVYTFLAPSQLHKFIELLKTSDVDLSNKFVTQITTSKHFYDVTAHNYINENCFDLNMKVIKGLSLDMEDLTKQDGQEYVKNFFNFVTHCIENNIFEEGVITDSTIDEKYSKELSFVEKNETKEISIVADIEDDDHRLIAMIEEFVAGFPYKVKIYNIRKFEFAGGCLGCFNCAASGKCIYNDKFDNFLRGNIQQSDAIVYAFTIKDHSMGSLFKMFDDRQFCNGHRAVTEKMPIAYIVNGQYNKEQNLKTVIEARAEVGGNYLAGVAYDCETLKQTINKLSYAIKNKYSQPRNFYGVGGMKIFRDLIWVMRGIMKADHMYYRSHKVYDFPQKQRAKMMLLCVLGAMMRNPKIKAKMGNKFNEGMISPYKKVLKELDEKKSHD